MAKQKTLKDVFEQNKYDLLTSVKRSRSWFEGQVALLATKNITPQKVLKGNVEQLTNKIAPGHLYMYAYDHG